MANISLCFLLILCTNVYNILAERNVAVGKPTNQSSTDYNGTASRAVDGNTSGDYWKGLSCSHTADANVNWWCVDLEESIDIERVKIYNLKFGLVQLQYRLKAFEIKLSSSGPCDKSGFDFAKSCYKNPDTTKDVYTVEECNQGTTSFSGRFVFISVNTNLVMCEVEIFEKCSKNCQNGKCDTSGVCNGCIDGRYGIQCDQPCSTWCSGGCIQSTGVCNGCNTGSYGNQCDQQCSTQCNAGCIQSTGVCNGCKSGRYEEYCDTICSAGCTNQCLKSDGTCSCKNTHYDSKCTSRCSTNCQDGLCSVTSQNPLQPQCSSGCIDGYTGSYCQMGCPANCLICDTSSCSVCKPGWYGTNCQSECSRNCFNGCQIFDGKCNQCKPGTVGDYCNKTCSNGCLSNGSLSTCDRHGVCYHGCIDGKSGSRCDKMCKQYCTVCQNNGTNSCLTCTDGRFGISCDELCNTNCASATHESNSICNISSGFCTLGCENGFYGHECKTKCNEFCQNTVCDYITGSCSKGCVPGKTGITCTQECRDGWYGFNCNSICGQCADKIACDTATGNCGIVGCQEGYTGPRCETEECRDGWYGFNCSSICGQCADNIACDKATGNCGLVGCQEGYTGPRCQTGGTCIPSISPLVAGIIGAISATGCSLLICFIAYCIYRQRTLITRELSTRTTDTLQMKSSIQCEDRIDGTENYQNTSAVYENLPTPQSEANGYETLGPMVTTHYEVLT